jgi:hypothetical protein
MVEVTSGLIDFNVNQNTWIPSMILYKTGFFGDRRGRSHAVHGQQGRLPARREPGYPTDHGRAGRQAWPRARNLADQWQNLQDARRRCSFDEMHLVFSASTPSWAEDIDTGTAIATAIDDLLDAFNEAWPTAARIFDARRTISCSSSTVITSDIGSTSDDPARPMEASEWGGSIHARMTGSGSPTASSTPITAS